jgi:hypothetical protein
LNLPLGAFKLAFAGVQNVTSTMPSHYRSAGLGLGPLNLHHVHPGAFSFTKGQHNVFDMHRTYQVDSCTSTFHPVKEDPSPAVSPSNSLQLQHPASCGRSGLNTNAEEVDVETILQMGDLQDWAWPAPVVEAQEVKPTHLSGISELTLPFSAQSMQLSSTIINPSSIHDDYKASSTCSLFGPRSAESSQSHQQQQNFDLQSWCSGVRSVQSPYVVIPRLLPGSHGGYQTSAEPSPTTDTSPLRLDTRELKSSPATTPLSQARYLSNSDFHSGDKPLGVQKTWQGKRAVTQRESHIWSERQRRKGMNHLFSTLRSLLPQPSSKVRIFSIVNCFPITDRN